MHSSSSEACSLLKYIHPGFLSHPSRVLLTPNSLRQLIPADFRSEPPVILCIGTDRMIGDSLGPMTGTLLLQHASHNLPVYGTLQEPVHALNLPDKLSEIKKKHPDCTILAVDASLGSLCEIGTVYVRPGSLRPGAGVSKHLPSAGNISITGITAVQSRQPYLSLQTSRLSVIASMADHISQCILQTIL